MKPKRVKPARGGLLPARSPVGWGLRLLAVVMVAVVGYQGMIQPLASSLARQDVDRAHALAPGDARIAARLAEHLLESDPGKGNRALTERLAKEALRRDPAVVEAAATLGAVAVLNGNLDSARRFFSYSERLSRRDLRTQLWAIEYAVSRNDIAGAMRHYDIALRTKRGAGDVLYGVLASAISEPAIRSELTKTLARSPNWAQTFIDYAAARASEPVAAALLLGNVRRAGVQVSEKANADVLTRLLNTQNTDAAWAYYRMLRPGAKRDTSRNPDFAENHQQPLPFDWVPVDESGISAVIQPDGKAGVFDFVAPASAGGVVLQQIQLLPPGKYSVEGHSRGIEGTAGSLPYWTFNCSDGREIGRIEMPASARDNGSFRGEFDASGCKLQVITLHLRPSNAIGGISGQIDHFLVRPIK